MNGVDVEVMVLSEPVPLAGAGGASVVAILLVRGVPT